MTTSTARPMLGRRTFLNGSNPDVVHAWYTPSGIARAIERRSFAAEVAADTGPVTFVPEPQGRGDAGPAEVAAFFAGELAAFLADADAAWEAEMAEDFGNWSLDACECDACILADAVVTNFAELAVVTAGVAAITADDLDGTEAAEVALAAAGWGDTFDPDDCQWGFTVRTRF